MQWRSVLLALSCLCSSDNALMLRYRLPHGPIRRIIVSDSTTIKDLGSQLIDSGAMDTSSALGVSRLDGAVSACADGSAECRSLLGPDDIVVILHEGKIRKGKSLGANRTKPAVSGVPATHVTVPSESLLLLRAISDGSCGLGVLVGRRTDRRDGRYDAGEMVFRVPFAGLGRDVQSSDVLNLLKELKVLQLICGATGMRILGLVVADKRGAISPRNAMLHFLVCDYLGSADINFISIYPDAKRAAPRKLSERASRLSAISPLPDQSYAAEGYRLTAAARDAALNGTFPSFFTEPESFFRSINSRESVLNATRPITVGGRQMVSVEPILLARAVAVAMQSSGVAHSFLNDTSEQALALSKLGKKMHRHRKDATALRSLLRDTSLLTKILESYYESDIPSFLSLCRFVFSQKPLNQLEVSSFLLSAELLAQMIACQCNDHYEGLDL